MDTYITHIEEIKSKNFNVIILCITEADILFNLGTFKEFKDYAEKQGLEVWATFWGLTAGESICRECDVSKWLIKVKSIDINNVMIDEPKSIKDMSLFTSFDTFFNFHLCLCDKTFNSLSDSQIRNLPVKSIGVSNYHWVKDWSQIKERSAKIAARLKKLRPKDNFIFIQGFDIPEGMEQLPLIVKEVCEKQGIKNFGFWSFKCTAATFCKRPVNYKRIWDSILF